MIPTSQDLIINFTPTGMIPTKDITPHVPVSANEIVEQVHEACEIGITMAHLHARDKDGKPTYLKNVYRDIMEGIRKHVPELVVCLSLSGRNFNTLECRSQALELYPDLGSLTLSSLNFPKQASVNSPEMINDLANKMLELDVVPELEIFDLGMINYAKYLIGKGVLKPPYYFNIIFNNIAGMQPDLSHIGLAISDLPDGCHCSLGGIGASQLSLNAIAVAMNCGVRVGVEDNIFYDKKKKKLASNMDLLKRIHVLAEIHERAVMPSKILGDQGYYNKNRFSF